MSMQDVSVTCSKKFVEKEVEGKKTKVLESIPKIEGKVSYNIPGTIEEAVEQLTAPVALSLLQQKLVIFVQDTWRRLVANGETPESATAKAAAAKPGVATPRVTVDPKEAYLAQLKAMTPEERKAKIRELQALAAAL